MERVSSREWKQFELLLKKVGYGCIYDLPVECGMPRVSPELHYRRSEMLQPCKTIRLEPHEGAGLQNARFERLISICEARGDTIIAKLEVMDGLPLRIETEGVIREL